MKTLLENNEKGLYYLNLLKNKPAKIYNNLMVNVKIDAVCLILEKDQSGKINFYTRNKVPLDYVKRVGVSLYENSIKFLEKRPLNMLPNNTTIHLEIFPTMVECCMGINNPENNGKANKPNIIDYSNTEIKNGMILSLVEIDGQMVRDSSSFASLLDIDDQPTIFLDTKFQLEEIKKLAKWSETGHINLNWASTLIQTLGVNKSINVNIESIEGAVFHFLDQNESFKLVNPWFKREHKAKNEAFKTSRYKEYSDHLISVVFNSISENKETFRALYANDNLDYIDFIFIMTVFMINFANDNFKRAMGSNSDTNSFHNDRPTSINLDLLTEVQRDFLKKDKMYQDIFRILLFNFNKPKKRCSPLINKHRKDAINYILNYES